MRPIAVARFLHEMNALTSEDIIAASMTILRGQDILQGKNRAKSQSKVDSNL